MASSQTTQFVYDGAGDLVKKIKPHGSKTLYIGGIYEVDKNSGSTVTGTETYYPAAGAMRVGGTLHYMLKDHLGSANILTNNRGAIVSGADTRYYPFGEARMSTTPMLTDKLFTGQREITGLGIYYYGARFYSPKLGRFLSADTIVPGYANPQNLNRFSYVRNNPLRYTDPTGHRACGDEEAISCETGLLNHPSHHTNTGCSGHGQHSCLGNSGNHHDDDDDNDGTNLTTPTPTPTPITETTPEEAGANDYSCFTNSAGCGSQTTPPTQSSTNPIHSAAEFAFGAVLVGIGAVVVVGGAFILGAAVV